MPPKPLHIRRLCGTISAIASARYCAAARPVDDLALPSELAVMPRIDHDKFAKLVKQLYAVVRELEHMFPGRPFTLDGHMVGSIGECMVADAFDLTLMPPSNQGFDAKTADGVRVEIKATQSQRVAFRSCPEHAIIIRIKEDGTFETCFNGPGGLIWQQFEGKELPKNGQYQIGLSKVRRLNKEVDDSQRIPRWNNQVGRVKRTN